MPALSWLSLCRGEKTGAIQGGNLCLSSPFFPLWPIRRRAQPAVFTSLRSGDWGSPPAGEQTHLGMDALKSAGRAIIKSPGVPRHTWGTSKHESECDGVCVCFKRLGLPQRCEDAGDVAEAVKGIKRREEGPHVPLAVRSGRTDCSGAFVCLGARCG